MPTPSRSRTARRYESVATKRIPVPVAVTRTPVRIGRASSRDAAGITWRSAAESGSASTVTAVPSGSPTRGNSSAGRSRTPARAGPATMRASSPSTSKVTAPAFSRVASPSKSFAGTTAWPASSTCAGIVTRMVRSRSEPTSSTAWSFARHVHTGQHRERAAANRDSSLRRPDRLGEGVTLASELHCPPPGYEKNCSCSTSSRSCGLWIMAVSAQVG